MACTIVLAQEAVEDLDSLDAYLRAEVKALQRFLRDEPDRTSKSRIKRLRGMSRPQYRLRVGDVRVFYDISDDVVEILTIVPKSAALEWLERWGEKDEESGSVGD